MERNKHNPVDYTIVSKPAFVNFICPFCFNDVEVSFSDEDFKTDYWNDGAYCNCPLCGYVARKQSWEILIMIDDKCCGTCKCYYHEDIYDG